MRSQIQDSSYGGSSEEEEEGGGGGGGGGGAEESAAGNALLYVGLGTVAIGLVIAFVGTGEKGFKTLELRLIGPTLIASGLLCCLLRVFLCVCPTRCLKRKLRSRRKPRTPADLDRKTEYYRHLPFNTRTAEDLNPASAAKPGAAGKKSKKRVSILPAVETAAGPGPGSGAARELPKIVVAGGPPALPPSASASASAEPRLHLHPQAGARPEPDLIELRRLEATSFDDLASLSSAEEGLALESLSRPEPGRLRSTLTFGDSLPGLLEEDAGVGVSLSSPLLDKELVLSPSNLHRND